MVQFKKGNMFDEADVDDVILITTNSFIKTDSTLAMGRGAALEAKERFPGIDKEFGNLVKYKSTHLGVYGTLLSLDPEYCHMGLFQVKRDFISPAQLDLIRTSIAHVILNVVPNYSWKTKIHINFPGIGCGGLKREDVLPLLMVLPDNVIIWEKEN